MLSVIIPVYNEKNTIVELIKKIQAVPLEKEVIVINNASTDGTKELLEKINEPNIRVMHHQVNKRKGGAVIEGLKAAKGEFAIIQDGDLEYDPQDYLKLIEPLIKKEADMVLGSRFYIKRSGLPLHRLGNQFLTGLLNFLFKSNINDYATCYKMARLETYRSLKLKTTGFDIDVEIICRVLKRNLRISEVPISYYPRNFKEGKKIRFIDGIWAIFSIFKYRFFDQGCL